MTTLTVITAAELKTTPTVALSSPCETITAVSAKPPESRQVALLDARPEECWAWIVLRRSRLLIGMTVCLEGLRPLTSCSEPAVRKSADFLTYNSTLIETVMSQHYG